MNKKLISNRKSRVKPRRSLTGFTHAVLFQIQAKEIQKYYRDCRMWARYAKKAKGFLGYHTMRRVDFENQPIRLRSGLCFDFAQHPSKHPEYVEGILSAPPHSYRMYERGRTYQFASVYSWKTKKAHDRFMGKFHDWLVTKSKAKVKVLGYYNLKSV